VVDTRSSVSASGQRPAQQVFAHWDLVSILASKRFREEHLIPRIGQLRAAAFRGEQLGGVRKFAGRGSIKAYLSQVIQRLLHDFVRKQQPRWLNAQPPFWRKVHRLLCLENLAVREVIEIVGEDVPGGRADEAAVQTEALLVQLGAIAAPVEQLTTNAPAERPCGDVVRVARHLATLTGRSKP